MANFTRLTHRLYTGGDLPANTTGAAADLIEWEAHGITHVIDNRFEWSDQDIVEYVLPHVAYLHNGVDDAGQRMPDAWFDRGLAFASEAWRSPDSVVFAHCHMGINRGPSMAYALLLATGVDPIEAIEMIRTSRPIAAVGYAEDALDWHLRRSGASAAERRVERARLLAWRADNPHDTVRIIRSIRSGEGK